MQTSPFRLQLLQIAVQLLLLIHLVVAVCRRLCSSRRRRRQVVRGEAQADAACQEVAGLRLAVVQANAQLHAGWTASRRGQLPDTITAALRSARLAASV